jgi:hypothetical protein
MNTNLDKLSAADLRRAADISEQIEELKSELVQLLSGKKRPGRKPGKKSARELTDSGPRTRSKAKRAAKTKGGRKRTTAEKKAQSEKMKAIWAAKKKAAKKK